MHGIAHGKRGIRVYSGTTRSGEDFRDAEPPAGEVLRREFDSVFRTGEILRFDIESSVSGDSRVFRVSKIPMRSGGAEVTHVITIGEDVTEAVRAQEEAAQAEKLAAMGTLAAGAMHEINNPLATISACAETLAMQLADPALPHNLRASFAEYLRHHRSRSASVEAHSERASRLQPADGGDALASGASRQSSSKRFGCSSITRPSRDARGGGCRVRFGARRARRTEISSCRCSWLFCSTPWTR